MANLIVCAVAFIFILQCDASLLCPSTALPTNSSLLRMVIVYQSNDIYRLSVDCLSTSGFTALLTSGVGRLAVSDSPQCPLSTCMFELSTNQKVADSNILHQENFLGGMAPIGFTILQTNSKMYCVRVKGDCGADLPIYLYKKPAGANGFLYAYSLDGSVEYTGYTKDATPVCFAWSTSVCGSGMTPDKLATLSTYLNDFQGAYRDHFTTTWSSYSLDPTMINALAGYKKIEDIGKVAIAQSNGNDLLKCNCLVKAIQMFDNQPGTGGSNLAPGLFGRFDHKLILANGEANLVGEQYQPTGETVYCVKEKGACGATVPLKKWFNGFEIDSTYTVDGVADPAMVRNDGILCYIWPLSYTPPGTYKVC